jgi:hypothetical protein
MSVRSYRRLTRFAAFALAHWLIVLGAIAGAPGDDVFTVSVASLPLIWGLGHYLADVQLNVALDGALRERWWIALWVAPWSMALYWLWHVRTRRAFA